MSSTVTLSAVSKSFASTHPAALADVSFTVPAASSTAILGPSGSGKSTILRILAGLEAPDAGRVVIDGVDVTHVPAEQRGIGMVAQRPLLFPHYSVLDNVAFSQRAAGRSRRAAREWARPFLELVQLSGFDDRNPNSLSGGQQQRVAIARALAATPNVLLLDEPFSALDPALRDDMHELLAVVRRDVDATIILVTHDRDEASTVADRIAVIEEGDLLQHDTVERMYSRPASRSVARIMGGKNVFAGTVRDGRHVSSLGEVALDCGAADGPGFLHFRQEDLVLAAAGTAPGCPPLGCGSAVRGTVTTISRVGPRRAVTVRCGTDLLHADLGPGTALEVGETIELGIPKGAAYVMAA